MSKYILVVSDTHGRHEHLRAIIRKVKPDKIYHLGDAEGYTSDIYQMARDICNREVPCEFIAGNCDMFAGDYLSNFLILKVGNENVYLCHGHREHVKSGLELLAATAKQNDCSIALYGHTHIPNNCEINGVRIMNPGSVSLPRQEGRLPSYGMLIVEDDGRVELANCVLE